MMKKLIVVLGIIVITGSVVLASNLYVASDYVELEKGKFLVITAHAEMVESGFVYASNPPKYPAKWVYELFTVKSLLEVEALNLDNIITVIKIGDVYTVEEIYETKEFKQTEKVFKGYDFIKKEE